MSIFSKEKQVNKVVMISLGSIVPNKSQPRTVFNENEIEALSESIKEHGVIQPVCVRKLGATYEIISGERRCRASKLAGLTEVPCIIMEVNDEKSAILALIENIQRSDLSFFEEAIAINKLISDYGLTQQEAAKRLGKAQSTIANKLRLLRFSDTERNLLISGGLTERQARAIIRIEDSEIRLKILSEVARKHLNLEQTEELVNDVISEKSSTLPKINKRIFNIPIPRLYFNSINQIVEKMKSANITCETSTNQGENYFEYVIRVPMNEMQRA